MTDFTFLGSKITAEGNCSHEIKRHLFLGRRAVTNLDGILKNRDIASKHPYSQSSGFSIALVVMYVCESWIIKKAECQRIDAFELWYRRRLFESPLDSKEIKPVNSKGNQLLIFIGRTDAEAKAPIFWPPGAKSRLIGKDPDGGKD